MVQKRKVSKPASARKKSKSVSTEKSKLGDKSLDWITDSPETDVISQAQAEKISDKSDGDTKKNKIGVVKHYEFDDAKENKDETSKEIPVLSNSNSTITKGKIVTLTGIKEVEGTVKKTTDEEPLSDPDGQTVLIVDDDNKMTNTTVEEAPIEIGKTYIISSENKIILDDEEEKTVSAHKDAPDDKKFSPKDEGKREDVKPKEEIKSKETSFNIPDESTSILKKGKKALAEEEKIIEKEKPPSEKENSAAALKEEVSPSAKKKWPKVSGIGNAFKKGGTRVSGIGSAMKKGGIKVSGAVIKPFKTDKTKLKESVGAVFNNSMKPVRAISAVDRKITTSMKKVVLLSDLDIGEKSIIQNIKSTDSKITKSAKKLIDSIID